MQFRPIRLPAVLLALTFGLFIAPAAAQDHPPAVVYESLMDSYFDDESGLISFSTFDLAFAPETAENIVVGVLNSSGEVLAQFSAYPDYKIKEGVFARFQVQRPADVQLSEPLSLIHI